MGVFLELSVILLLATGVSFVMRFLRQPLIVGYIFTGILAGPYFFDLLHAKEPIELFSKIGITILLFIVGLNLSPQIIREVGKVALLTGLGQILFTSLIGYFLTRLLGIPHIASMYVAIALTFSSTIVILKLLSDKGDLNKLYGKIAVGFLLVQDVVAIIILLIVSSFAGSSQPNFTDLILMVIFKSVLALFVLFFVGGIIIPRLVRVAAVSQEFLFLFSLCWGLGLASLFYLLGFSVEIGALIAGVTLSLTPFAYEIAARLKPLRDFFIVLFFILLGSQMVLDMMGGLLVPALVLSLFVLLGHPLIMILLMNLLGFKRRVGFLTGLTSAQISEFSLILATLGFSVGHLTREMLSLVTMVGLVTILGSTYLILYADKIYPFVSGFLKLLEFKKQGDGVGNDTNSHAAVLFGYDRVGNHFVSAFTHLKEPFIVIDFNPRSIERLEKEKVPYRFGDAEDAEFLAELGLGNIKLSVSTIPDYKTNHLLTSRIRAQNPSAIIITISQNTKEAHALYKAGATYVVMPHYLGALYASKMIAEHGFDEKQFAKEREKHLSHLQSKNRSQ